MQKLIFVLFFIFTAQAFAYPDFISYGYTTCISCHYNSHGYGPLTDYGRALFSQEIAARNFWTKKSVDDETIAAHSQFIPGVDLPFWVRPGIKYRGLWVQTDPGSSHSKTQYYQMQRDVDLVFSADRDSRTVLVLNYGLTYIPDLDYYNNGKKVDGISREHYIRFFPMKKLLVAAGLMDIAYGLRTGDHTSVARSDIGLGQDDQVHGVMAEWFEDKWDATLHAYVGNLFRPKDERRKGFSAMFEYLTAETNKVGFSAMQANSNIAQAQRFAVHDRLGIPNVHGSSIIAEVGLQRDKNLQFTEPASLGMYGMLQSIIRLTRGYNIQSTIERAQSNFKSTATEKSRWTLGFLMFPLQRTELRVDMVQIKQYSPTSASPDETQLQGQLHVSW